MARPRAAVSMAGLGVLALLAWLAVAGWDADGPPLLPLVFVALEAAALLFPVPAAAGRTFTLAPAVQAALLLGFPAALAIPAVGLGALAASLILGARGARDARNTLLHAARALLGAGLAAVLLRTGLPAGLPPLAAFGWRAAATLGLPERAEHGKNYDYRYVWLRDQAYAGLAVSVLEPLPLLDEAVAFTTARVLENGDHLRPAYRLDGSLPPAENHLDLPGYPGGAVVTGNWVRGQFQLDSMGELLQLYAASGRHDHLSSDDDRAVATIVETITSRWTEPDAGIWELEDDWWIQSRLACVAGLRVAARDMPGADTTRLLSLADAIMAETSKRGLGTDGAWKRAPGRAGVDASLLLAPVRGALPADDPRSRATLAAVTEQLGQDGYLYRYAADDRPLGSAEGAFLMCGFAMSLAQLADGNRVEAYRWFERQRAACGTPGLLAEEFDVQQRQLRGNLPQGFVHALLLEASQTLGHTTDLRAH